MKRKHPLLSPTQLDLLKDLGGRSIAARSVDVPTKALRKLSTMKLVDEYTDVSNVVRVKISRIGREMLERLIAEVQADHVARLDVPEGNLQPKPFTPRPRPNTALIAQAAQRKYDERIAEERLNKDVA